MIQVPNQALCVKVWHLRSPRSRGKFHDMGCGRSCLIPRLRWVYGKHKFAPRSIAG
jgi:hypothetical protein